MASGTFKRLVRDRGFGFIRDDGGQEWFFHRSAVKAGTFTTPEVRPGSYFPLRIEITVKRSAAAGAEHRVRLTATSVGDPARADTVVALARAFG